MSKTHLILDPRQTDFDEIVLKHAHDGKKGWMFAHLHPKCAKLLEKLEEVGHGQVTFELRDGLPENVRISQNYDI